MKDYSKQLSFNQCFASWFDRFNSGFTPKNCKFSLANAFANFARNHDCCI